MRYFRAYMFLFDSPNWLANFGFVTLCLLSTSILPLFGHMLAIGYLFEVVEAMHRQGDDRGYPDFTWDRFVEYLVRGAQVVLVQFLAVLPLFLFMGVAVVATIAIAIATASNEPNVALVVGLAGGCSLLVFVSSLLNCLWIVPLTLRIGLGQDLGSTYSWGFIKDYARRMWGPTIVAELFLGFSSLAVMLVGMAICCVGVYFVMALPVFARMHLNYQLYEMYLERGGIPISLKIAPPPIDDDDRDYYRPNQDPAS